MSQACNHMDANGLSALCPAHYLADRAIAPSGEAYGDQEDQGFVKDFYCEECGDWVSYRDGAAALHANGKVVLCGPVDFAEHLLYCYATREERQQLRDQLALDLLREDIFEPEVIS